MMAAGQLASTLLTTGGIVAVAATCSDRRAVLRGGLALAAALGLAGRIAAHRGSPGLVVLAALLAVNLFHLALLLLRRRRARFTDEEAGMADSVLATLDRRQARHLIDQGIWIDGRPGEVLTREGRPVGHLFFLCQGTADVTSHGRAIATLAAPALIGEVTVLDESGATATVTLAGAARFWCVSAAALRRFLTENPDIRVALENSFAGAMAEKLRAANRARAGDAIGSD